MQKISIKKSTIINTIFICIIGIILHFTYKLSNNNRIVALFSAINESTWEHLKLLYFPMLITTIIGYIYYKNIYPNYLCIKTEGILLAIIFTIIFYYTYIGILGYNISLFNISSFFISTIIEEYYTYKYINTKTCSNVLSTIILVLLLILFIIFTFNPPHINLFIDPINKTYGVNQNK